MLEDASAEGNAVEGPEGRLTPGLNPGGIGASSPGIPSQLLNSLESSPDEELFCSASSSSEPLSLPSPSPSTITSSLYSEADTLRRFREDCDSAITRGN